MTVPLTDLVMLKAVGGTLKTQVAPANVPPQQSRKMSPSWNQSKLM